jgi:hypothetical protein
MIVKHIQTEYCAQIWKSVEPFIVEAYKQDSEDYSVDQIKAFVLTGQWILLVAVDAQGAIYGAMTVSFLNYPNDRIAFITATGGKTIISEDTFNQMAVVLKSFGATKVQSAVRESMSRLLSRVGFNNRYIVAEKRI